MKTIEKINIAYADDHTLVRQAIADSLNSHEDINLYIQAVHGKELLDSLNKATYLPDICMIDISIPVMDGYETVRHVRKQYPAVKCLAVTILNNEYAVLKMLKNGACGYLDKAEKLDMLYEGIKEIHFNGHFFSNTILGRLPKLGEDNKIKEYTKKLLFSENEEAILALCGSDLSYAEIGRKIYLSQRTVENYVVKICEKLNIHSRAGLAVFAQYVGIGGFKHPE